jgi:phosphatidylinositol-3-phosphatase
VETDPDAPVTPAIKNVWIISLGTQSYDRLFARKGGSKVLTGKLADDGVVLSGYHAIAHGPLASTVALVSGQGPNPALQAGCPNPAPFPAGDLGTDEQALGSGCIFSDSVFSIADQTSGAGTPWRAYGPGLDGAAACASPASAPTVPFLRFTTVTTASDCASHLVDTSRLATDLKTTKDTPMLSYLVPDPCHDAGVVPCKTGAPAGPTTADAYLSDVVGQITASPAYKAGGLIAIVPSDAPGSGSGADSTSCCERPAYPNTENPGTESEPGPGGGLTGALLLSPLAKTGKTVDTPTDTLDLLRSISEGLQFRPLGLAGDEKVKGLGAEVWKKAAAR